MKVGMIIMLEKYVKKNQIEANTMLVMAERQILPAVLRYQSDIAENAHKLAKLGVRNTLQIDLLNDLETKLEAFTKGIKTLKADVEKLENMDEEKAPRFTGDVLAKDMEKLREIGDSLEVICSLEDWPMPTYSDLLFKI